MLRLVVWQKFTDVSEFLSASIIRETRIALMKRALITIDLHIILNFLLQQLVSGTVFTWETYILR
jgi:hypothetical protein